jgi:glycosyltransferase involved in cell wall biosynthesis
MRILILSPHSPCPPNSGGRIRTWEQIKYLGQRHDVTAVCYALTEDEYEMSKSLEKCCAQAITVKHSKNLLPDDLEELHKLPWPIRGCFTSDMRRTLEELRPAHFDIAIIEFIYMAHYRDLFPPRTILHEHNIESTIYKQYSEMPNVSQEQIYGIKKQRAFWKATWMLMEEYENKIWPRFPLRVVVSQKDKQEMDSRCHSGRSVVIENGVNTRSITLFDNGGSHKILFMGTMDYYPNADAATYLLKCIMPLIWKKDPAVSLCIAGKNPPPSIREFASNPKIEVIANPEDMNEVAKKCCLTIVPLRFGGGTRIKILDSLAMGLPVVSTSLGCEGLSVRDGCHILVRDNPEQFADAVLQVISDPFLAYNLKTNGRRLVEECYDWGLIFGRLEEELLQLVQTDKLPV